MSASIYKSEAGEAEILALYDEALSRLGVHETLSLNTSFGETCVITVGDEDAPPLLFLPGGNFLNPSCLEWFLPLAGEFRIFAPDIVGQPGRSAQTRPTSKGDGHARWVGEILDALGLQSVPVLGVSYGAGITLRVAGYSPDRVSRAALVSPSGLVRGPIPRMLINVVLPMLKYQLSPTGKNLRRAARPLLSEDDEFLERQLGAVYRNVRLDSDLPRRATADELRDFHSPTVVFAAGDDIFFPGRAVAERARAVIPNLATTKILEGSHHIPSRATFTRINDEIRDFLTETNE